MSKRLTAVKPTFKSATELEEAFYTALSNHDIEALMQL